VPACAGTWPVEAAAAVAAWSPDGAARPCEAGSPATRNTRGLLSVRGCPAVALSSLPAAAGFACGATSGWATRRRRTVTCGGWDGEVLGPATSANAASAARRAGLLGASCRSAVRGSVPPVVLRRGPRGGWDEGFWKRDPKCTGACPFLGGDRPRTSPRVGRQLVRRGIVAARIRPVGRKTATPADRVPGPGQTGEAVPYALPARSQAGPRVRAPVVQWFSVCGAWASR
jgi:hypothetical protein